jgi:hypothetical protein
MIFKILADKYSNNVTILERRVIWTELRSPIHWGSAFPLRQARSNWQGPITHRHSQQTKSLKDDNARQLE